MTTAPIYATHLAAQERELLLFFLTDPRAEDLLSQCIARYKGEVDEAELSPTFNDFWELYQKKVDKARTQKLWKRLLQNEKEAIMDYLPRYLAATPEKTFRKDPSTFLNNSAWKNEIIQSNGKKENNRRSDAYYHRLAKKLGATKP